MSQESKLKPNSPFSGDNLAVMLRAVRMLGRRSSGRRLEALQVGEDHPSELAIVMARASTTDPEWLVRDWAATSIATFGTSLDTFRVKQLLKDPSWVVRSSAVGAVDQVFGKKGEELLISMLQDRHPIVRRDAAKSLGDLGLTTSIAHLKNRLFVERHDQARIGIWAGLFSLGEHEFIKQLLDLGENGGNRIIDAVWNSIDELADFGQLNPDEVEMVRRSMDLATISFESRLTVSAMSNLKTLFASIRSKL